MGTLDEDKLAKIVVAILDQFLMWDFNINPEIFPNSLRNRPMLLGTAIEQDKCYALLSGNTKYLSTKESRRALRETLPDVDVSWSEHTATSKNVSKEN
jgi:hypothetical protein